MLTGRAFDWRPAVGASTAVERSAPIIEAASQISTAAMLADLGDAGLGSIYGREGKRCVGGAYGGKDQAQAQSPYIHIAGKSESDFNSVASEPTARPECSRSRSAAKGSFAPRGCLSVGLSLHSKADDNRGGNRS